MECRERAATRNVGVVMQKRTIAQRTWPLLASAALFAGGAMAGPLDSLQPGQWYEFPNSRIADVLPSPLPEGNPVAMLYYSGGAFDTRRNRLLVWGGGHAAYNGNELYAFDVAAGHWSRLTNPTATPGSVHSYDQLEYLPRQDLLMAAGGSVLGRRPCLQRDLAVRLREQCLAAGGEHHRPAGGRLGIQHDDRL